MSSVAGKPNLLELDLEKLQNQPIAADVSAAPSRKQFEHMITAAEVMGDFSAAAIGVISAYGVYHLLNLGKDIFYPPQTVTGVALAFSILFVLMLDREGTYRQGHGLLRNP